MNKKFTILTAALALLTILAVPIGMWGQSTYTKVTTTPSDWSGTYVIVADGSNVIFTGQDGSNNYGGYTPVTITNGSVTGNYSNYEVLIEKSGDYYTMKHVSSGKYLGWNSGNNLHFSTTAPSTNAFKWSLSTSSILNANDDTRKLQYNSGSPRFACYTSSQKVAYLYLKQSGSTTYTVTYDGNGATSGDVPTDANAYDDGDEVTVLGNTGSLAKTGYTWSCWNTQADGGGQDYSAGSTFNISENTTLYAKWASKTITELSYTGTPTKTTYAHGESFDPTGLTVTATFNDASTENVTTLVTWTPDPLTTGTTSVTGTYMTLTVNVSGLTVTAAPEWVLTNIYELTADDIFVIVGTHSTAGAFSMSNNNGTSSAPTAAAVTIASEKITSAVSDNIKWNISGNATDGYTFYPNGTTETWLYCSTTASSGSNNNMKVGTGNRKVFIIDASNHLVTKDDNTDRYISVQGSSDWRGYISSSTEPTTVSFYKYQTPSSVASPVFSVEAGTYNEIQTVEISCATSGATIYYTTDGTEPTTSSATYSSALSITQNTTLKAKAYYNSEWSNMTSATYTLKPVTPTFDPVAGVYVGAQNVTITSTSGATIYYTLDGSDPTNESTEYTGAINITATTTVKAIAVKSNWDNSEIATAAYTITVPYTTIPALFDAATSTATNVMVAFGGWVVSGVSTNGKNVFVTDNAGNGFVIYSSSSLAETYAVGKTLTGTTECSLKLNQNYAQLQNVTASELTIADGGTVTEQTIAMASLSGVNTGALVSYNNLTCSVSSGKYYLSDGTTTLQVYNSLFAFDALTAGKTYNITGIYQQYGDTKEILPRSAADIEEVQSDTPSITVTPNPVEVSGTANNGTLTVTYNNVVAEVGLVEFQWCNADGSTPATENYSLWLNANLDDTDVTIINYAVGDNDGAARTAYFKIYGLAEGSSADVYSEVVSFTQAAYVPDYAYLPFEFVDKGLSDIASENGLTAENIGSDYSSQPKLKFESKNNNISSLTLKTDKAPQAITFDMQAKPASGTTTTGTFNVQTSVDGETYTDLATYTEIVNTVQTITLLNTNDDVRFVKWVYSVKGSGNVALGNIYVDEEYLVRGNATVSEDLTLIACEIRSEGKLTIESGATFTVTEPYALNNGGNSSNLVIKDGGQLKTPNEVYATVEKNITGYGTSTKGNYYLVSAPAQKYLYVASDNDDVDAYHFDASEQGAEWRNFKLATGAWHIAAGNAVLYATKENSTLSLDGYGIVYNTPNPGANIVYNKVPATNAPVSVDVRFNSGKTFQGFNLIGNPFTCKAYLADVSRDFYRMNADGNAIVLATDKVIDVCEGIFVVVTESGSVTFQTTDPAVTSVGPNNSMINLSLSQNRGSVIDNARIRFGEGSNLPKLNLLGEGTMLYIPQGSKDYSVVYSNGQGEMPVNFKATENGSYTLSFSTENAEMDYLHLIDNMTGADVDLLQTPSYTFNARTTDYASRFRLVFSANSVNDSETGSETFAFFNGSEWVINASADATLQVVDMMGRIVLSTNGANTVSTNGMAQGVYVMRLVNGNDVKTQKIVVQ